MLPREEQKERNTAFWNALKTDMKRYNSKHGVKRNWIGYQTEVKDVYLRMEADGKGVRLCFDIQPKDDGIRSIVWEQMTELKRLMTDMIGEGIWEEHYTSSYGITASRIYWEDNTLNFYKDEDLPKMRAFLKDKLIKFDEFYQEFKEILINLTS